ncbi:hypothetical protein CKO25_10490 [Thiocapsa imhoffii]|uniref:Glycosyl transferase family 1 domain-containing protein n=1 Tax=Thiocapsa imhoffii TaxID=382777 RepID=A0A9X0WHY4_9GAMM|nr:glycosyltransferase family 1 protein [Thiocapsa imhoffii]MBK1645072.1 hypothetical protein [Thiocapsa imhoffii]
MSRLRVALLSTASPGMPGSMSVYAELVARGLATSAPEWEVELVQLLGAHEDANGGRLMERFNRVSSTFVARGRAQAAKADVYHLLDASFGYMVAGLPWSRTLVTVHDVIPALQARGRFGVRAPGWAARQLINASLRVIARAGWVCAVSRQTADDVHALTGRFVDTVIHLPIKDFSAVGLVEPDCYGSSSPFVLHVGNNSFYKNRTGVLSIFSHLVRSRPTLDLVMAGPAPTEELRRMTAALNLETHVRYVVNPEDAELAELYRRAVLLLFPSLYEGFGWPPLEALRMGCPVVCADTGSLPEVVGDAGLYWSPTDTVGFATQALRLLDDPDLRRDMLGRAQRHLMQFDTRIFAQRLVKLYRKVAAGAGA